MYLLYSTPEYKNDIWLSNNFHTYILLKKNADPVAFEKKMPQLIEKYFAPQAAQALGTTWEKLVETGLLLKFSIQNVRDIHLNTDISGGFDAGR